MFLLFLAIITLYLLRKANKYLKLKKTEKKNEFVPRESLSENVYWDLLKRAGKFDVQIIFGKSKFTLKSR